jgi:hypothetical protein
MQLSSAGGLLQKKCWGMTVREDMSGFLSPQFVIHKISIKNNGLICGTHVALLREIEMKTSPRIYRRVEYET